jgi:hypothetical protein
MNFKKGDIIIITICMPSASSVAIVSFKDGTSIENHRVCMGVCVYIYICIWVLDQVIDMKQGKKTMIC